MDNNDWLNQNDRIEQIWHIHYANRDTLKANPVVLKLIDKKLSELTQLIAIRFGEKV